MTGRRKKMYKGINAIPEIYDGSDVLSQVMSDAIDGKHLQNGIYVGRVLQVLKSTDPADPIPFKVKVRIPEFHSTIPEPAFYNNLSLENLNGINYFLPSPDAEEPCPGMTVHVMVTDTSNCTGMYMGPIVGEKVTANTPVGNKASVNDKPSNSIEKNNEASEKPIEQSRPEETGMSFADQIENGQSMEVEQSMVAE